MDILTVVGLYALAALAVAVTIGAAATVRRAALDISRARDLTSTVTTLADEISAVRLSLKKLNSRAGMRELRERANGKEGPPDWRSDPEGFRSWARGRYGVGPPKTVEDD